MKAKLFLSLACCLLASSFSPPVVQARTDLTFNEVTITNLQATKVADFDYIIQEPVCFFVCSVASLEAVDVCNLNSAAVAGKTPTVEVSKGTTVGRRAGYERVQESYFDTYNKKWILVDLVKFKIHVDPGLRKC